MHYTSYWTFRQVMVAFLTSGGIAAGICASTSIHTAANTATVAISVNRAEKADRLPLTAPAQSLRHNYSTLVPIPTGCESAFSALAEPTRIAILRRCLA
jgi:hypothetical protein